MTWLSISRPWFWLYLAGPYLVGFAASAQIASYTNPLFWVFLLYFLFPANLLLYGVNDVFDQDTDAANPKKGDEEHLLSSDQTQPLFLAVLGISVASLFGFLVLPFAAGVALITFLLFAWAYSTPPVRLKARAFLDSASNVLYVLPGLVGYYLNTAAPPSALVLIGAAAWTMAMHLYSAIPDIEADRQAGLNTTAVVLGERRSLLLCLGLWTAFTAVLTIFDSWLLVSAVYPLLCAAALVHGRITDQYWYYPYINAVFGFAAYWYVTLPIL